MWEERRHTLTELIIRIWAPNVAFPILTGYHFNPWAENKLLGMIWFVSPGHLLTLSMMFIECLVYTQMGSPRAFHQYGHLVLLYMLPNVGSGEFSQIILQQEDPDRTSNIPTHPSYMQHKINWETKREIQKICLWCGRPGFDPWVGKMPWGREWKPLPGESPWTESLAGYLSMGSQRDGHNWATEHNTT